MGYTGYTMTKEARNAAVKKLLDEFATSPIPTTLVMKDFYRICESTPVDRGNSIRDINNFLWVLRALRYKLGKLHKRVLSKKKDKYILCLIKDKAKKNSSSVTDDLPMWVAASKPDSRSIESFDISDLLGEIASGDGKKELLFFNLESLSKIIKDQNDPNNVMVIKNSIVDEVLKRLMREMPTEALYKTALCASERLLELQGNTGT